MIDIATLKEYIKVLENSSLQTMELSDGTDTIHLEKPCAGVTVAQPVAVAAPTVPEGDAPTAAVSQPKDAEVAEKTINAPIVGVFYAAPSPDSTTLTCSLASFVTKYSAIHDGSAKGWSM